MQTAVDTLTASIQFEIHVLAIAMHRKIEEALFHYSTSATHS